MEVVENEMPCVSWLIGVNVVYHMVAYTPVWLARKEEWSQLIREWGQLYENEVSYTRMRSVIREWGQHVERIILFMVSQM